MRSWWYCLLAVLVIAVTPALGRAESNCSVKHQPLVQGGVANSNMRMTNDGKPCIFDFKFGGTFEPSDWRIEQAPQHGQVETKGATLSYLPDAGYAGADQFTVAVFGFNPVAPPGHRSRNGRFSFTVNVRAGR